MTAKKDLKRRIRERMEKTGESYTTARVHVLGEKYEEAVREGPPMVAEPVEAIVLKLNQQSARLRVFGESEQITFRTLRIDKLAPGRIARIRIAKRWTWREDQYASGSLEGVRTDVAALGLDALPLEDRGEHDLRETTEPFTGREPFRPLWERLTDKPRPAFEFHPIAWMGRAAYEERSRREHPVSDAAELMSAGERETAYEILMDVLCDDLRCIDAHAHLGHMVFDRAPADALVHYEIGVRIGELSVAGAPRDLLLPWGCLYNRPFLRCLKGYGLCLWRLGRTDEARRALERVLTLNPTDNQGVREPYFALREGRSWDERATQPPSPQVTLH